MQAKIQRTITSLLVIFLIIATLPLTAFAETSGGGGVGDKNNSGSGQGGGASNSAYTWTTNQSGYRFVIVDNEFKPVSNTVDIVFSNPRQLTNPSDWFISPRGQKLDSDKDKWTFITVDELYKNDEFAGAKYPPVPIKFTTINGKTTSQAQGEAFKKWFLAGEGSISSSTSDFSSSSSSSRPKVITPKDNGTGTDSSLGITTPVIPYIGTGRTGGMEPLDESYPSSDTEPVTEQPKAEEPGFWESVGQGIQNIAGKVKQGIENAWNAIKGLFGGNQSSLLNNPFIMIAYAAEVQPTTSTEEGYYKKVLNYIREDGSFLFELTGTSIVKDPNTGLIDEDKSKYVVDVMIKNNYSIAVEPIFWFVPAASNSSGLPTSPIYSNYVYGTVGNFIDWYNLSGNSKYGTSGGAYSTLIGSLGWRSMYLGENWVGASKTITVPNPVTGKQNASALAQKIAQNQGIAMHIYITNPNPIEPVVPEPVAGVTPITGAGGLTLTESEVSKSLTTIDSSIPNWGLKTFTFNYSSMYGTDTHTSTTTNADGTTSSTTHNNNAVFGDPAYKYIIENSSTIDNLLEANSAGGAFASKMLNNQKSGNANINGGTNTMDNVEYQTTIWRGDDIPTLASYKENSNIDLKSILNRYGLKPAGDRGQNGVYQRQFTARLDVSSLSDLKTNSVYRYTGGVFKTATHNSAPITYTGTVNINVYRGSNNKSPGTDTNESQILTTTPFGAATSLNSSGSMIQQITPIYFYPYLRMTYMSTGSNVKTPVNILSQFYSVVLPNNFAEAAWYNDNESESLTMSSTQWSLSARAVNGDKGWNKPNQVLPGGAIYQLSTGSSPTKVALVTWQTILQNDMRNSLYTAIPANEYTLNKAITQHQDFVNQAKSIIEGLRVVQWINTNTNATNAWDSSGSTLKIKGGGQSLSAIGLSGTTSTEDKYHLKVGTSKEAANEGDLDVIEENNSKDVFFKIFAAPDGSIYMAKSIGDLNALANINGTSIGSATKILDKSVGAANVETSLTDPDARALNQRTLIVTNIVKSLERNAGNDPTATWVNDGRWFNESMDGIVVVRKATILDVGFLKSKTRSAVLDPRLMPVNQGISDLFTKAYLSQFRLNEKSDVAIAQNKAPGFIGTFQGKDIKLPDMQNMYQSKRFFVPNVSVQDLR